jgi:putative hydrolase of the HAD superfamily
MALRAVAFDLDGTLYPYRHLALRAAAFGFRHARYARAFQRVREQIRLVRPISDFRERQVELFAAAAGLETAVARKWIERRIYDEWVHSFHAIRPYRGLREALDGIERRGLGLAVLSDFPVADKLGYLGLAGRFRVALCAEESGYLKPSPEPFALLERRLSVRAEEILFVGDSYDYDIIGAHAAGLRTAHIARRTRPASVADITFRRYTELMDAIARS